MADGPEGKSTHTHSGTEKPGGDMSPGQALAETHKGNLPRGSVQQILAKAPEDIKEEILDIPEWGYSVLVKSFTAAESARVKSRGFAFRGEEQVVAWAEMEIMQFALGVKDPAFTEEEVLELHLKSGRGFARVIKWLDENSGLDKEALQRSREEFQRSEERSEVQSRSGA